VDPDPDPGGPKTYGSVGSGSGTLVLRTNPLHKLYKKMNLLKPSNFFSVYYLLDTARINAATVRQLQLKEKLDQKQQHLPAEEKVKQPPINQVRMVYRGGGTRGIKNTTKTRHVYRGGACWPLTIQSTVPDPTFSILYP